MSIQKELIELIQADVISQETADRIHSYYKNQRGASTNRLFIVFGILGAILVGLGIILIIAHNWDDLSRATKDIVAFLPLVVGQLLCGYSLLKQKASVTWRESSAAFLYFAVGASISLVSQIYNISGDTGAFLLLWMLLCLPLIYVMNSAITSLLYLAGITYYGAYTGYGSTTSTSPYLFWLLLLGMLPYYYRLFRKSPESNFIVFHHWLLPLSVVGVLGTVAQQTDELMYIAYISLFGLSYTIGDLNFFKERGFKYSGYRIIGFIGTISLLLTLSFDWFWVELRNKRFPIHELVVAPEFIAAIVLSLTAAILLVWPQKNKGPMRLKPLSVVFVLFLIIYSVGLYASFSVVLINILVFTMGVLTIKDGAKQNSLGTLNVGLLIVTLLVLCRFFDRDLSFVIRGLLFVTVGVGFFVANYWILKKRKTNED